MAVAKLRTAALKALLDEVKKAYDASRAAADEGLVALYAEHGVTQVEVRVPGFDRAVAQISLSEPKTGFVVNEAGFLAFCKAEHPTEVDVTVPQPVETVRPAWRKALLARMEVTSEGKVVDTETGRVLDFVAVAAPGPPSTVMTWKTGGREEVARAYRDGRLTLGDLLALPSSPQE